MWDHPFFHHSDIIDDLSDMARESKKMDEK
jgi:hypothetical protein